MWSILLVQADRSDQVDLQLVTGGDAAYHRTSVGADVLGDREDRGDVVARVGVVRREERVVVVELAHGDAVRPCRPFRAGAAIECAAEHGRARAADRYGVVECLLAGGTHRCAGEGCRGHRRIVDHAVDDHVDDVGFDLDRVGGDLGDVPGELPFACEVLVAAVDAEVMDGGHDAPSELSAACRDELDRRQDVRERIVQVHMRRVG